MDEPKKRRLQFGLRTLLGVVALVGVGLYLRPGQVDPTSIQIGASKAWVYWNCGKPDAKGRDLRWDYGPPSNDQSVIVIFDGDERVENVIIWPKRWRFR